MRVLHELLAHSLISASHGYQIRSSDSHHLHCRLGAGVPREPPLTCTETKKKKWNAYALAHTLMCIAVHARVHTVNVFDRSKVRAATGTKKRRSFGCIFVVLVAHLREPTILH